MEFFIQVGIKEIEEKNLEMSNIYHQANFVFWQSEFCKNCANKFLGKRKGP